MSVEQLIREAMAAFAETVEPDSVSFRRIAVQTRSDGHRVSWLRYAPAAVAAAAVILVLAIQVVADRPPVVHLVTTTSSPAPPLDASYTSPEGDWSFAYPKDWTLREGDESGWLVFNFEAQRIHELPRNGEILIRWGITPRPDAGGGKVETSTQDVFDRVCAGPGPYPEAPPTKFRVLDCRWTEINGRSWVMWLGALGDARLLDVSAIFNDKLYRASAMVGAGDQERDVLDVARQIFHSFELRSAS